jgi:bifunctional non-homologous end joining protein LigD
MLASPGPLPTEGGAVWAFEVKWDGMRAIARTHEHGMRLTTRSGADATERFPEVSHRRSEPVPPDSVLDGEVVALDDLGRPSFALLSPRIQRAAPPDTITRPVTYVVFDVLRVAGRDVLELPYDDRRALLLDLIPQDDRRVVVADSFDDGAALLAGTEAAGLEGVVAKRRTSHYQPGVRSSDWIKVPHRRTRSYVVGGWKARPDSPSRLASVLVGTPTVGGTLVYDGAVGSGLSARESHALLEVMAEIEVTESPFTATPDDVDGVLRWVEPVLVADVEHLGRSGHGHLRQPSLVRLRPDLSFDDVLVGVDES